MELINKIELLVYLLGINYLGISKEGNIDHGILTVKPPGSNIFALSPCIANTGPYSTTIVYPFPPRKGAITRKHYAVETNQFIKSKKDDFIDNYVIKEIDTFFSRNIKKIIEYAKTKGTITFVIKKPEETIHFLKTALPKIINSHKWFSLYSQNIKMYPPDNITHGKNITCITFFNIKNCISIFNRKKVDGVGVTFSYLKEKKLSDDRNIFIINDEVSIVLSNYPENVFVVDGTNIDAPSKLKDIRVDKLIKCASFQLNKLPIKKMKKVRKKEKIGSLGVSTSDAGQYTYNLDTQDNLHYSGASYSSTNSGVTTTTASTNQLY